ncbi:SH3 domain-containing protein [Marinovum sp.]|uniref:SH3 domain-containing protein n=1 Tax=Marinovum sp. TaxID=2024839 RepID=UPI002B26AA07|nr:SH3 domain-containing protein [Marinovum sp.]
MKTYVWLTFAFLGWGYYEASGGADFKPGPDTAQSSGLIAAAEAETQQPALQQVASAETPPRGTVQRQLESALLTALRDKHPATSTQSLSNVQAVSFAAEAPVTEATVQPGAKTIAPPMRPDDLVEVAETIELAIGPNTAAAPDASPRPRLRPRELAGAPTGAMPTISTRGDVDAAPQFETGRITASRANMRMGPGTNFPVLRAMTSGAQVRILRSGPGGWVKLKSMEDGRIGWMAGSLVAKQ